MNDLATVIKKARTTQKLTRETVSLHSGVSQTTIYELENGRQTVAFDKVIAVARALGVQVVLESPVSGRVVMEDDE